MPNDVIQADYEALQKVGGHFGDCANQVRQYSSRLDDQVNVLQGGEWVSPAANIFYSDMNNDVMPGIDRLHKALHDAESVMSELVRLFGQADEEAAQRLNLADDGSVGAGGGGFARTMPNPTSGGGDSNINYTQPTIDGNVPLYTVDLMDPNFDAQEYVMNMDTDGRPVVFMVHGWSDHDGSLDGGFAQGQAWFNEQYGHLPESQRPILVGVAWDAEDGVGGGWGDKLAGGLVGGTMIDYADANRNSIPAGQQFSEIVENMNYFHPDTSVNVVAHSLGNRMVMEGVINDNNIRIDNYIAVEPAVTRDWVTDNSGRFGNVIDGGEVGNITVTYTGGDKALWGHGAMMGEALGHDATGIDGIRTYNMSPHNAPWYKVWETNHYSYNDPDVMNNVYLNIFGEDGSGFQN